ncbi:MAG: nuclear transport factor 2 family protein [Acidobacteria bacterium]|nr:nuclear transport factor 2 family protein [Acidobacteriota bacterium]
MKKFAIFSFIIFALTISAFGQKTKTTVKVDSTKPVREAFDRLVEGIKQADAEKVMSVYDKSDKILFFNNNGSATIGWETMKKNRDSSYEKATNVNLEITGLRIEMLGSDSAYLTNKWKQSQEYDGKLETASGRMTIVFKKIGKDWKAVHLHTSPDNPPASRPVLSSEREVIVN